METLTGAGSLIAAPLLTVMLYFVSRQTIRELFLVLYKLFRHEHVIFMFISLLFLPGTIFHELCHLIMAFVLLLKVRDFSVFPTWQGNNIKLGHVIYEKRDVFRSVIVGIAPIVGGLLALWSFHSFQFFPNQHLWVNLLVGFAIFQVSSSMFSSKQDMVDSIYVFPLGLLVGLILFIFNINPSVLLTPKVVQNLSSFTSALSVYLGISLAIHVLVIVLCRVVRKVLRN